MAKKAKAVKVVGLAGQAAVLDDVNFGVITTSERPEVYDARADERDAKAKADFAAAALNAASDASMREPAAVSEKDAIADSRKSLLSPLAAGQRYFESPEGFVVVGNSDDETIWCQRANGGQGMKINPKR